jgi:serine/threonine protein kinase/ligand-binding sensor domain-containing protein
MASRHKEFYKIFLSLVSLCLCGFSSPIRNPQSEIDAADVGRLAFRIFTDRDGLPQNAIMAMAFDQKGYLWVGTEDGAAYYNGRKWIVVDMPNRTLSNNIRALIVASDGTIWFGRQDGGLSGLKDGKWTTFDTSSGLPGNSVGSLLETVSKNGTRALWAGTDGGLARFENGKWSVFDARSGLPNNIVVSLLETVSKDGTRTLWAGTDGGGLARFENGKWTTFDTRSGLPNNIVVSLLKPLSKDDKHTLWVGTFGGGLARLEEGKWIVFDTGSGLRSNNVFCMVETLSKDGKSTFWVGTRGGGLARLENGHWTVFDIRSGLPNNEVSRLLETVSQDGRRTLWVGTRGGLARLENGHWTTFDTSSGLPSNRVWSLLETTSLDGTRTLWAGTERGLARFENGKWTIFDARSGLPNNIVVSLLETVSKDGTRTLWVGTFGSGLVRFENGKWTTFDTGSGLPSNLVQRLLETVSKDGTRTLWVGTDGGGLARFENGKWTTFDAGSGLPGNRVRSLLETTSQDGRRTLWIGTRSGGVARLDLDSKNAGLVNFSNAIKSALPYNYINQILEDAKNQIYLLTDKGIVRLTPRAPTPDDPSEYSIYIFTTGDGLPSNETTLGASMVDSHGRIWAGTVGGAAMFDPSKEFKDRTPKPLYVESGLFAGKKRTLFQNESLPYNENNFLFEYALLSYYRESDTRYRTQLVGLDEKSSDWSERFDRTYTNLPEGDYIFKVWGRDYAGNISGPVEMAFNIRPAPWRTWWAYSFYMGALTGVGYFGYRRRLQALERRNRELEAKVQDRTVELENKNQALAQQRDELAKRNEELIESHKRADRIFSALADALPGTVLDEKYRIEEKIGSGGFGAVYRAVHLALKRPIAVKIFKPSPGNDSAENLERFRLEAVSACRINHPNAVAVLDSGISLEGIAYLVMELLEGRTLKQVLNEKGRLSVARMAEIALPVCDLLSKAHAIGIIHRDIKPENIFLHQSAEGEIVKVVDFGIAKLMGKEWGTVAQSLTQTGALIGTPAYIAPERLGNTPYDGKADVYSLGAMLYEMLCGSPPFHSTLGPWQTSLMHLTVEPAPLRQICPSIPEALDRAVLRALIKDPEKRSDADELKRDILTALVLDPSLQATENFKEIIYERSWANAEAPTAPIPPSETGPSFERKGDARSVRWKRLDEILDAAMERSPEQWPALLNEVCAGDADLRREAESLLAAHLKAEKFLSSSAIDDAISLIQTAENKEIPEGES